MIVDVAVPFRVARSFHYLIEPDLRSQLAMGSLVEVKFRNRSTHAFVLGFPESSDVAVTKLKSIESVMVAEPLFDEKMLKFLTWVSDYYCHPLGEVIAAAIPKQAWIAPKRKKKKKEGPDVHAGLTPLSTEKPTLTSEQQTALAQILDEEDKRPVLLHGVTGSGKTEVYMRVLEATLEKGKGAIILVPEIALTPQLLGRFSTRFPGQVAVLHSDLTPSEKFTQWERIRSKEAKIVIGARSAVFAPVDKLGLIVIDEEHESSFKQEDSLRYHARDIAVVRAHMEGARIVLGSATPSLESYANAHNGKYRYVTLKDRVMKRAMPTTTFVDLKEPTNLVSPGINWLSQPLLTKIQTTLKQGQQVLLYLNRLGFAHFLFCKDCGHTWRCRNCDVALTYYRHPPGLRCHYCGDYRRPPEVCETCQGMNLESMGVGTEQVEKTLTELLPEARIARMDRSVLKTRKDLDLILNRISQRQVDIAIGTQMIAKGHDFPGIALVGILLADASLNLPDFRAHERTFQIVTQVSGRAGRADIAGEVVVQTVNPDHPVLRAAAENRADDFYRQEMDTRRQFSFPPFQRLAMLRFQHRDAGKVEGFAVQVCKTLETHFGRHGVEVIGPAEAPLSRVKQMYRWHCLIKSDTVGNLQRALRYTHEYATSLKSPVAMAVDVDPVSAL